MSATAGFILVSSEALANYAEDAIDLENNADADLVLMRWDELNTSPNFERHEFVGVTPSFSRHPHANIPRNMGYTFRAPLIEAPNPGNAGGESPVGITELLEAAGLSPAISSPGDDLVFTPSTQPTRSCTMYRWERELHGSTPLWTLARLHGCRHQRVEINLPLNQVAMISGNGNSANFPGRPGLAAETATPWGKTAPAEWFDDTDVLLDQFGDSLTWSGSLTASMYTPLIATFMQVSVAGSTAPVEAAKIIIENTIDERPLVVGGAIVFEQRITGRTIRFEATLKDRTTYEALKESVRDNLTGDPGDELVSLAVAMDDGKGSGGTSIDIAATLQYDPPSESEQNSAKNWSIVGLATPDWSSSLLGDDELTITVSATS